MKVCVDFISKFRILYSENFSLSKLLSSEYKFSTFYVLGEMALALFGLFLMQLFISWRMSNIGVGF